MAFHVVSDPLAPSTGPLEPSIWGAVGSGEVTWAPWSESIWGQRHAQPGQAGMGRRRQTASVPLCPSRPLGSQPLWKKVLTSTAVGLPLLLGVRYLTAEPQERRRMRLMVDGVTRFVR